jgi:putative phosphoribosyl transferase
MISFPDLDDSEASRGYAVPVKAIEPYPDLATAGRELALKLEPYRDGENVLVLALVLGGVPVAHEVASHLRAPLDLVIIRRLLAPKGPGSQLCAVSIAGSMIIDQELIPPSVPSTPLEHFLKDAIVELKTREQICRRQRPPINLAGKTVVLVDCGIRSGSTMLAAIKSLRTLGPARIIAAVPVASLGGQAVVAAEADEVVCLARPRPFGHVGLWYKDFMRPGDDRVGEFVRGE